MSEHDLAGRGGTKPKNRNPFPGTLFFTLPIRLYDDGYVRDMRGAEFKRLLTLYRLANFKYGKTEFQTSLQELQKLDGVSPRCAFLINTRLKERGLILVNKRTKPFTYTLVSPDLWPAPDRTLTFGRKGKKLDVVPRYSAVPWGK